MPRKLILILSAALWLSASAAQAQTSRAANSWTTGAPMPTAREYPFTGVIGQKIYVIGGANDATVSSVNEVYDTVANTWTTAAPMPTARWDGASAVVNNIIYTIGGGLNGGESNVVEAYDPSTDTWSAKAPLPGANDTMYATVVNNIIYVIGGCCGNGSRFSTVLSYDPSSDVWNTLAPLKIAKSSSAVAVFGSMIVSAGGLLSNSNATTDNEGYDVAGNSWTTLAPLPAARHAGCFESAGGVLYFAGGHAIGNGNPVASMVAYNPSANSWTTALPSMPDAVVNPGSASVDGRLYCFGGSNSGGPFQGSIYNYLQIYQPAFVAPSIGGVISASQFGGFTSIAPGSFIEIYGSNLATGTRLWNGTDFVNGIAPTSLEGTTVEVGGQAAFVNFISPGQVNALVPSTAPTGAQQITVTTPGGTSNSFSALVASLVPGLLAPSSFNINGTQYAAAFFPDTTAVLPTGAVPGVASRPAKPGDVVTLYGVGFGTVTPNIPAGQLVEQSNQLSSALVMYIGNQPATVQYAGLAPTFTGLYQFNVVVPELAPGAAKISFSVGDTTGTQQLYLAVGN